MSEEHQNLNKIREEMRKHNLNGYLVPHQDQHLSEYIAESDERLAFLTGFSGSFGVCLVLEKEAFVWVDSRYYIQAQKQLHPGFQMMKYESGLTMWWDQLNKVENQKIGFDPKLMTISLIETKQKTLNQKKNELIAINDNLVDIIWENKPQDSSSKVFAPDQKYFQETVEEKLKRIRDEFKTLKITSLFTGALDQIMWTLNLRGNDIDYNPVFKSYLWILESEVQLFVNLNKMPEDITENLKKLNIIVYQYETVFEKIQQYQKDIGVVKEQTTQKVWKCIQKPITIEDPNPIEKFKAIKGEIEVGHMKRAATRDSAILVATFAYLNDQLNNKALKINEYDAGQIFNNNRLKAENNQGISFTTISSSGPNAAIVHYSPEKENSRILGLNDLYLVDSGAQYLDGTTDVTRTVVFGQPNQKQIDYYTYVLQGNLEIQMLQWPEKHPLSGAEFDILARKQLFNQKLDYGHATGHGIGYYLCCHEGPIGIYSRAKTPFKVGHLVSDEPGVYIEGEFGIRIEDDLLVIDKGEKYIGFYNITRVPYERKLINKSLLSPQQLNYLNQHHQNVFNELSPLLKDDPIALEYLKEKTAKI